MASERLDSWKAIAAYLNRDESTVRRWEKEGLPVHRHVHKSKASVYAYRSEEHTSELQSQSNLVSLDRKSTRLNSSHSQISYAVFCLKKKKTTSTIKSHMNSLA